MVPIGFMKNVKHVGIGKMLKRLSLKVGRYYKGWKREQEWEREIHNSRGIFEELKFARAEPREEPSIIGLCSNYNL